jgi:hypothetical protein
MRIVFPKTLLAVGVALVLAAFGAAIWPSSVVYNAA